MDTEQIECGDVRTLPLWKHWFETHGDGLVFGDKVTTEAMEEAVGHKSDTIAFKFAVSEIRKCFRRKGMHFTASGMKDRGFVVAPPEHNADEMVRMDRLAMSSLAEAVVLGTNTQVNLLAAEDRKRHESITAKIATRLALLSKNRPVQSIKPIAHDQA